MPKVDLATHIIIIAIMPITVTLKHSLREVGSIIMVVGGCFLFMHSKTTEKSMNFTYIPCMQAVLYIHVARIKSVD